MMSLLSQSPEAFFIFFVALVSAITVHEFCHAFAADRLGDPTPQRQGRVSLNPIRHLDLMGTLLLFLFGFGWGKPVQFDPFNLKNPHRDSAIISLVGPASNFVIAILFSIIFYVTQYPFLLIFVQLNVMLGVFNLLPVHPLDGFKIVGGLLPEEKAREWYQLERYGLLFLILLILPLGSNGSMLSGIISPVISFVMNLLISS